MNPKKGFNLVTDCPKNEKYYIFVYNHGISSKSGLVDGRVRGRGRYAMLQKSYLLRKLLINVLHYNNRSSSLSETKFKNFGNFEK